MAMTMGITAVVFLWIIYWSTERIVSKIKELTELCKKIDNNLKAEGHIAIRRFIPDGTTEINLTIPKVKKHEYEITPVSLEVTKSVEESYYPETTVELPAEIKVAKKTGPKPRLRTEEEMKIIISSILSDKKERGNTSATLFKKYKITKATFYKYATEDQSKELVEMQTVLRKKRNFSRGRK